MIWISITDLGGPHLITWQNFGIATISIPSINGSSSRACEDHHLKLSIPHRLINASSWNILPTWIKRLILNCGYYLPARVLIINIRLNPGWWPWLQIKLIVFAFCQWQLHAKDRTISADTSISVIQTSSTNEQWNCWRWLERFLNDFSLW